jgi:hypothetical protein
MKQLLELLSRSNINHEVAYPLTLKAKVETVKEQLVQELPISKVVFHLCPMIKPPL